MTVSVLPALWNRLGALELNWSYTSHDRRDLRIDLLRGLAVFVMVVDHIGGASWLYAITGGNRFWVSAAEVFVLLSGLVVGMVYGGIALREGLRAAQIKSLKRAWTLYKLTIALTLLTTLAAFLFGLPWAKDIPIENPLTFIVNVLTLHQVVYLTDIPQMYTFFLFVAPIALWLLYNRRTTWLLVGSVSLWAASFLGIVRVPWEIIGGYAFNLGAWQLLFFGAMAVGYHADALKQKLGDVPRVPYLILCALIFAWLIQTYRSDLGFLTQSLPMLDIPTILYEAFRKTVIGPGRLIANLVFIHFAFLALTLLWKPIAAAIGWLLVPLGQNSLYSYTMHLVVIVGFAFILPLLGTDVTSIEFVNTLLQLLAVFAIWMMTRRQFLFRIIPR